MPSSLAEIFENEGDVLQISGNNPILLDGKENVWFVLSGSAEVFAVQVENGRPVGRKEHFFSVQQGEILFGMDLDSFGLGQGFQAVGFPGTHVARLGLDRLAGLVSNRALAGEIASLVDRWVAGLSEGLTRDIVPRPRPDILLEPGTEIASENETIAFPRKGTLWIQQKGGTSIFIGMEEISETGPDILFPLCEKSWIQMLAGSVIETHNTDAALASGLIWISLDAFYEMLFQILVFNTRFAAVDTYNLLKEKADIDRKAREAGLAELASILKKRHLLASSGEFEDHVLAACALVGERLGLSLREPTKGKRQEGKKTYTIEEIAKISRVNIRKVSLRGDWWKQDNGPLVGFLGERNSPVALLPISPVQYEMVDPATGTKKRVGEAESRAFSPLAYTFYRYFPDRVISGMDLVRFGLKGCYNDIIRVVILGGAVGILSLIVPLATGLIFSDVIPGAERARLLQLVVIIACFAITTAMFEITRNVAMLRVENKLGYSIEAAIWDRILRLPIPFFRRFTSGNLAMRGMGISLVRQVVTGAVVTGIIGSIFSLFNYFLLYYYDVKLALVATVPLILAVAVTLILGLVQLKYYRQMADIEGRITGMVLQFVTAITKLRVSGSEDRVFSIWAKDFSRQKKMAYKGGIAGNILITFSAIFPLVSLITVFSWLVLADNGPDLSTGGFLGFNAAYSNLQVAILQIIMSLNMVVYAVPFYERTRPILDSVPEVDTIKADPGELNGGIELYHIFFRYSPEGQLILKDISMRLEPGEFVAVVGPSGSGKSTLIRLLLGFERPESGTIYYDDQDLAELDVTRVRQNMGVVLQGGNIMPGDIFTNITGTYPLTIDDAWEAARMAGLDEDIKLMPMGMHTVIMEGASTLSGGQRQRMMIARAIVNRPRILIFDEATSSLDNRTQAIVSESLKKLKATRLVVAHRISTIMDADRIYVMDRGEIVETGTYEELMKKGGMFEKLARRQII